jgi:hypothetical protein
MSPSRIAALLLVLLVFGGVIGLVLPPPGNAVSDAHGPVRGAVVRYQGQCPAVLTDARGHFKLPSVPGKGGRITAWKAGYRIAAAPADREPVRLHLIPLPTQDNDDYVWLDPTPDAAKPLNCGNCHAEIHREWSQSSHARAGTNPRMLSVYEALLADRPDDAGVCARCHAPTLRDSTGAYDLRELKGVDRHGVHCDYCHKIVDAPTDKLGLRFGSDGYHLLRPHGSDQLFFGPLDDAFREGESFGYSSLYKESRYCASCHEGVIYGTHVYSTYSEWLASPARLQGKQCQSCHMAPTGKLTNIAPARGGIERNPITLASHALPGGTREMLHRCLSLNVRLDGLRVVAETRADNVGHRVPTGWIDRHLVLVVEAFDAAGQRVALIEGPRLPLGAGVKLAGAPGWIFGKQFNATPDAPPLAFWKSFDDPKDTRLFPGTVDRRSFTFAVAPVRVQVRLVYRRFWQAWIDKYGWADQEVVIAERTLPMMP